MRDFPINLENITAFTATEIPGPSQADIARTLYPKKAYAANPNKPSNFIKQWDELIDRFACIAKEVTGKDITKKASSDESYNTITDRLKKGIAESIRKKTAGLLPNQTAETFATLKYEIEAICYYFKMHRADEHSAENKAMLKTLVENLDVCGPGLYTHISETRKALYKKEGLFDWLAEFRGLIVEQHASLVAQTVYEGNQIHVLSGFHAFAKRQQWHLLDNKSVQDDFVNVTLKPEDYAGLATTFLRQYKQEASAYLAQRLKDSLQAQFKKHANNETQRLALSKANPLIDALTPILDSFGFGFYDFFTAHGGDDDQEDYCTLNEDALNNIELHVAWALHQKGLLDTNSIIPMSERSENIILIDAHKTSAHSVYQINDRGEITRHCATHQLNRGYSCSIASIKTDALSALIYDTETPTAVKIGAAKQIKFLDYIPLSLAKTAYDLLQAADSEARDDLALAIIENAGAEQLDALDSLFCDIAKNTKSTDVLRALLYHPRFQRGAALATTIQANPLYEKLFDAQKAYFENKHTNDSIMVCFSPQNIAIQKRIIADTTDENVLIAITTNPMLHPDAQIALLDNPHVTKAIILALLRHQSPSQAFGQALLESPLFKQDTDILDAVANTSKDNALLRNILKIAPDCALQIALNPAANIHTLLRLLNYKFKDSINLEVISPHAPKPSPTLHLAVSARIPSLPSHDQMSLQRACAPTNKSLQDQPITTETIEKLLQNPHATREMLVTCTTHATNANILAKIANHALCDDKIRFAIAENTHTDFVTLSKLHQDTPTAENQAEAAQQEKLFNAIIKHKNCPDVLATGILANRALSTACAKTALAKATNLCAAQAITSLSHFSKKEQKGLKSALKENHFLMQKQAIMATLVPKPSVLLRIFTFFFGPQKLSDRKRHAGFLHDKIGAAKTTEEVHAHLKDARVWLETKKNSGDKKTASYTCRLLKAQTQAKKLRDKPPENVLIAERTQRPRRPCAAR